MNELLILVVLLLLSAFFSGAEIALISLADFKIRYLKDTKARGAKALASIRQDKQKLLITILIGNNVVNIAASSMATKMAIDYSESRSWKWRRNSCRSDDISHFSIWRDLS